MHPSEHVGVSAADLERLNNGTHHDPHSILGAHADGSFAVIRTLAPGAETVHAVFADHEVELTLLSDSLYAADLGPTDGADADIPHYQLRITYPDGHQQITADGYRFMPTLGEMDQYLIGEGRHEQLWTVLGANPHTFDTPTGPVTGTAFAVWAPNARGVSVVGDFCSWNALAYPMRSLGASGVWELFIPDVGHGAVYKYCVRGIDGRVVDHADPLARWSEVPPATGSRVYDSHFEWSDAEWIERRPEIGSRHSELPIAIYEVHVGSWRKGLSFRELAHELADYVVDLGFTHIELLPVAEHPFGGSWGYQVTGYYAPTSRYGEPDDFRYFVDHMHSRGIGVIVDWVPAHFPKDEWALGRFDGTAIYEHADMRRGEHPDWGTYIFDFGRREVRNFLVANALYWAREFHVDGLRVDAVASMLYLDYSREGSDWLPNQFGGRENLEAISFLQEVSATLGRVTPGVLTIAEESTAWPGVTAPTSAGGLGFARKWNMGWMNDTLSYTGRDPVYRQHHHNEVTFSAVYAWSEKYVLPFSHDEVVHGKGSMWQRQHGDAWARSAQLRSLYAYMWAHPGKKLMFMGLEFGQTTEWNEADGVAWHNLDGWESEHHLGIRALVARLGELYRQYPALYALDDDPAGFQWIEVNDQSNNVLSFLRTDGGGDWVACVINFSGTTFPAYRIGVPVDGWWEPILDTADLAFGGGGTMNDTDKQAEQQPWNGREQSLNVGLAPFAAVWLRHRR